MKSRSVTIAEVEEAIRKARPIVEYRWGSENAPTFGEHVLAEYVIRFGETLIALLKEEKSYNSLVTQYNQAYAALEAIRQASDAALGSIS